MRAFCLVAVGWAVVWGSDSSLLAQESDSSAKPTNKTAYQTRFDHRVREDLFAGFEGDEERLKKGMDTCEEVLAKNPKHAEAMVWRGAARVYLSGEQFSKGDVLNGMKNWSSGIKDMDEAKKLEPDNVGVLIPRAAVMLPAGKSAPPAMGIPVLKKVREDFERVYERQQNFLDKLGEHPHGELRMGLADVYRALGAPEKSKEQLEAVVKELPDSEYASEAQQWLKAPASKKLSHNCIGCHSE